jgi:hypothetical protein
MTIKTKVVWADTWPGGLMLVIQEKLSQLVSDKFTDGLFANGESSGAVYRTWTTTEAAQEWIDFLNQQSPAPIEAVVIIE